MLLPHKVKIPIATVIKTHGIKGELNVLLSDYTEPQTDFAPGACLIAEIDGLDVPFFVASSRTRGEESALITLHDLADENDARSLVGHQLYVYADPDPDPDNSGQLTAGELIGYQIIDSTSGKSAGTVAGINELTPGNWYFTTHSGRLIPAVSELIADIDHRDRKISMTLPSGLLEL